ncbi:MAG: recombinase family protein [Enhydrobacter sp.]
MQSQSSIEDQLRLCGVLAQRNDWALVRTYSDRAISGASLLRPQIQRLLEDARRGEFEVVVVEALDRLSRDQEDIAGLFKRLRFQGIKVVTCSEGEISELHVGLKGTMNALFLKDLAAKTHRGLEGRIRNGRSAGGLTFGYDVDTQEAAAEMRGARKINVAQAAVVRRIFQDFVAGKSPIAIARSLNGEQVPGPGGRPWLDTTIRGHAARGTGILRNELYVGRLVWNRLKYSKDPDTGRRLSRLNPKSEWVIEQVPGLRIIDQDQWQAVAGRLAEIRSDPMVVKRMASRFWELRRPKFITTGRVTCGDCGRPMAVIGKDYLGCNHARRRGTCENRASVRRSAIERLIVEGLRSQLMAPELVKEFVLEVHAEVNRRRSNEVGQRRALERELPAVTAKIGQLVDAVASGIRTAAVISTLEGAEARKLEIEQSLLAAAPSPLRLHPALADTYRQRVTELHEALANPQAAPEAVQIIQSLIEKIVVLTTAEGTEIELVGDIAAMVNLAQSSASERKKAALLGAALSATERSSVKVVAGAGFEPTTFRL